MQKKDYICICQCQVLQTALTSITWSAYLYFPSLTRSGKSDTGYPHDGRADKDSYPHDGRADNDSYPHDGRADKDSYPHDRYNQCSVYNYGYRLASIN